MKKIWEYYLFFFNRSWHLITKARIEWEIIAKEKENVLKKILLPAISLCSVFSLIGSALNEKPVTVILLQPILIAIILVASVYLTLKISRFSLQKMKGIFIDSETNLKLISHSFIPVFAIRLILSLFPDLFFLKILSLYAIYLLIEGLEKLIPPKEEEKRDVYLILISCCIIFLPFLFEKMFHLMLPNLPF